MIVKTQIKRFMAWDVDEVNKFLRDLPEGRYVGFHVGSKDYVYVEYTAQIDEHKKNLL